MNRSTMREGWALLWKLGRFNRPYLDIASASAMRKTAAEFAIPKTATPKWKAEVKHRRRIGTLSTVKVVLLERADYDAMVQELEKHREQS